MSTTQIKLTDEQLTSILEADTDVKYQLFKDSAGSLSINENSTFPDRLKFYMDKKGVTAKDVVNFFRSHYPFLAKSTSSIQHYINGVRTPRLSAVFALADFLDIAPAILLPAKPGKYIEYKGDHVEMITPIVTEEDDSDLQEPVDELFPGTLDALEDLTDLREDNNVVVPEARVTIADVTTPEVDITTTSEETSIEEDDNVVIEAEVEIPSEAIEDYHSSLNENDSQLEDEIKPISNLQVEEDDFDTSNSSDQVKEADNFLRELFSESTSTPYEEYTNTNTDTDTDR